MDQLKIEGDSIDNAGIANRGAWDMPYSGTFNPNSSPMPFNYPGEPPRYLFDKDESGSGNLLSLYFKFLESNIFCKLFQIQIDI